LTTANNDELLRIESGLSDSQDSAFRNFRRKLQFDEFGGATVIWNVSGGPSKPKNDRRYVTVALRLPDVARAAAASWQGVSSRWQTMSNEPFRSAVGDSRASGK
jgi:hypothetical protein